MNAKRLTLMVFVLLCAFSAVAAENFRVHKTILITLPSEPGKSETATAYCNDAVSIILPEDKTFIQGIEISIKVPQVVVEWRDSVAWSIYKDISPRPTEKKIDYKGTRIHTGTYGISLRKTIQIPLVNPNTIKRDSYSEYLPLDLTVDEEQIFFRMQLAMKGASDDIPQKPFEITVRPLLIDKGRFVLNTESPDGKESEAYTLFIDGKSVSGSDMLLDTGTHTVSLVSDSYRNEVRTINITQGATTDLSIRFRDITPQILIASPDSATVFIDGQEVANPKEPYPVQQGDHMVKFVIGDYEVVKQVSAVNGRSYTVAVSIDAEISESE